MFRKAVESDIESISEIYDMLHDEEEKGNGVTGWERGVYPTRETAQDSVRTGDMFVLEKDGKIVAAAKLNKEQVPEYKNADWKYDADPEEVMVIHTLVVPPYLKGHGYGSEFVKFYESYALEHGCRYLRMDTNKNNLPARSLYKKLGYDEVGIVSCEFNGIPGTELVCLEKKL